MYSLVFGFLLNFLAVFKTYFQKAAIYKNLVGGSGVLVKFFIKIVLVVAAVKIRLL